MLLGCIHGLVRRVGRGGASAEPTPVRQPPGGEVRRDALTDYEPPELAKLFEDFDIEVTYNKHERKLQLAATLGLESPQKQRDRLVGGRTIVT
jgi:hypothetical protein